jgi:uncharacterized protein
VTIDEKRKSLIEYRLKQAEESYDEAKYLFDGRKNLRSVMNRFYYAMFYSVLALLVNEQFVSSKHKGVISFFNKRFVKEGIFPEQMGKTIREAFELRQTGDYKEYSDLLPDQVNPFINKTRSFIDSVKEFLKK